MASGLPGSNSSVCRGWVHPAAPKPGKIHSGILGRVKFNVRWSGQGLRWDGLGKFSGGRSGQNLIWDGLGKIKRGKVSAKFHVGWVKIKHGKVWAKFSMEWFEQNLIWEGLGKI